MLGVSKAAISRWESDQDYPSFEFLPKLREHLHRSLDDLLLDGHRGVAEHETPNYLSEFAHVAQGRDEIAMLLKFRRLPAKQRRALLVLLGHVQKDD